MALFDQGAAGVSEQLAPGSWCVDQMAFQPGDDHVGVVFGDVVEVVGDTAPHIRGRVILQGFEQLQLIPMLVITPLTFLGGAFYSIEMLPPFWRTVTLFNPVVYLVDGFRWSFFGRADVGVGWSLAAVTLLLALCMAGVSWIFRTGYRLKS